MKKNTERDDQKEKVCPLLLSSCCSVDILSFTGSEKSLLLRLTLSESMKLCCVIGTLHRLPSPVIRKWIVQTETCGTIHGDAMPLVSFLLP